MEQIVQYDPETVRLYRACNICGGTRPSLTINVSLLSTGSKVRALAGTSREPSARVRTGATRDDLEDGACRDGRRERDDSAEGAEKVEYYDEIYFDSSSDEEEEEEEGGRGEGEGGRSEGGKRHRQERRKVRKLTNDELFYDPNMDDEDEKWVARQRMAYHNGESSAHACISLPSPHQHTFCAFFVEVNKQHICLRSPLLSVPVHLYISLQ